MLIDAEFLDQLTEKARKNSRLRLNYNLHATLDAKAQRLFNALEPGTFLPIHRHQQTDETYILMRGAIKLLLYDYGKKMTASYEISEKNRQFGFHIPKGQWHS